MKPTVFFYAVLCLTLALPAAAQDRPSDAKAQAAADVQAEAPRAKTSVAVQGAEVACENGSAAGYPCQMIDLVAFLPNAAMGIPEGQGFRLSDMWGWTDPETGKEWALVTWYNGTSFVDISDPLNPVYVGQIVRPAGTRPERWADVKVYQNVAYLVADNAFAMGVQMFDLTRLRTASGAEPQQFTADARYTGVGDVHNIFIDEDTGFAYVVGSDGGVDNPCGKGMHILSLSEPLAPEQVGCFSKTGVGRAGTGYVHDTQCVIYDGPDADYTGRQICFNSSETDINIVDVTDKAAVIDISDADYPSASYVHQGWVSEDHRYFFQNDELDEYFDDQGDEPTRTFVWDLEDLDDPILAATFENPLDAVDHNLYVHDGLMYQGNYTAGVRVLNVRNPLDVSEVAFFDTTPNTAASTGGQAFDGAWIAYPFYESGIIAAPSRDEGLFLLRLDPSLTVATVDSASEQPETLRFETVYPNPIRDTGTLTLHVARAGAVDVALYDARGRRVAAVFAGTLPVGEKTLALDMASLPAGSYLVRATSGGAVATRSVTLVR